MNKIIAILCLIWVGTASAAPIPTIYDTLNIGNVYSNDTLTIKAKIKNLAGKTATIKRVYWKPNSDFSPIKYNKGSIKPGMDKYFNFKVRNIVKRNAKIQRTLIISTEYQIYNIEICAQFKSEPSPHKEKITLPNLAKITSNSKSPTNQEEEEEVVDEIAMDTTNVVKEEVLTKKEEEVKSEPKKKSSKRIVRSPNITTDSVIQFSTALLGTPYLYGGYSTDGFDCSGFVQYVYKGVNYNLPRTSRSQALVGTSIELDNAKPGDLIFFEGSIQNGVVGHVGIIVYVDDKGIVFIHSSTKEGVTLSELSYDYYSDRFLDIRRVIL